jgi:TfoX/Sxy family transcriptional regulator of competence genes
MATDLAFVTYVREQTNDAGAVSYRKMFGEYALYCDGKIVGLVCDNQFYVKPTVAGRAILGIVIEAPPYPGAKPYFLIGSELENQQLMTQLIQEMVQELPAPKPKKTKS